MSDIAIRVENLSKQYRIAATRRRQDTLKSTLTDGLRSIVRRKGQPDRGRVTIWALKDVSFEVKEGEIVGIIGSNGAGKSTLLKILSRITKPSGGRAEIFGTVGSLLEVGTGFSGELSGRENIYMNGAILGMKKTEIDRKFDEIVSFAEVAKFIDTPVKHYSSGMYVRLAFAVAAHLEPEILIVDEVLAVGDAAFQKKCLGKMEDVAGHGRTVLFVSHNMAAVEHLCQRGITLQAGNRVFSGTAKEAIDYYLHTVDEGRQAGVSHVVDLSKAAGRRSGYRPLLQRLELFTDGGRPLNGSLRIGAFLQAHIYFRLEKPTASVDCGFALDNLHGQRIFSSHSAYQPNRPQGKWIGEQTFICEIPSLPLIPGEYKIGVGLEIDRTVVDIVEGAARLTVVESDYYGTGKLPRSGMFVMKHNWYFRNPETQDR
jgi:lipopolysaccharide transport system ATP-binding protein